MFIFFLFTLDCFACMVGITQEYEYELEFWWRQAAVIVFLDETINNFVKELKAIKSM